MPRVTEKRVINPYQRKIAGWYDPVKGHTGIDQAFSYELLLSPVSGVVRRNAHQNQMGKTMYIEDSKGGIHVFAHLESFLLGTGDSVSVDTVIAKTGNTGSVTSGPHLHYEIITPQPVNEEDKVMNRKLFQFSGFNTDPLPYLENMQRELAEWEEETIEYATEKKYATQWEDPDEVVGNATAEHMFHKLGLVKEPQGNLTKVRLAEIIKKSGLAE